MILDLNLDPGTEGNSMETLDELNLIGSKHFVPVVIYTGYAIEIDKKYTKKWRFITVIEKGADLNGNLEKAIKKLIKTKLNLQSLTARMTREITSLSMDLLDEIFEGEEQIDEEAIQVLMISRLSALLTTRLDSIFELGTHIPVEAKTVYPPLAKDPKIPISMGDVLKDTRGDNWFLVTPTCDMVNNDKQKPRVKDVLLLRCFKSPEDRDSYLENQKIKLKEGEDVSFIFKVPSRVSETKLLLIHSKLYRTQPYTDVVNWEKQLSITSLYAVDAKTIFIRDLMRLGVPETNPSHDILVESFKNLSKSH